MALMKSSTISGSYADGRSILRAGFPSLVQCWTAEREGSERACSEYATKYEPWWASMSLTEGLYASTTCSSLNAAGKFQMVAKCQFVGHIEMIKHSWWWGQMCDYHVCYHTESVGALSVRPNWNLASFCMQVIFCASVLHPVMYWDDFWKQLSALVEAPVRARVAPSVLQCTTESAHPGFLF